jgi:hypothetical protein
MLRKSLAVLAVLAIATSSRAGTITIDVASAPSSLAGFTVDTLTAKSSDPTDKLVGFDFVGDGTSRGFFGAMNQINPFGLPTIFTDNNAVIPAAGGQVDQDSQFKMASASGISVNTSESASKLQGAFNLSAANAGAATNQWIFAQIVRPNAGTVQYTGAITVHPATGDDFLGLVSGTLPAAVIPEPATMSLLGLAMVGGLGFFRRRSA